LTPKFSSSITCINQNNEPFNSVYGQKRKREDDTNGENSIFNQKRKRREYYTAEESSISADNGKCENDTTLEEGASTFKKGHFDNKPYLNTRREASKVLKKLLESLDQEYKSDIKDVYYIIENRDKVGIPLVSLKVMF
jgi:hypothetical protein